MCPAATYDYTPPEKVNVNVYNSTSRPGLARTVADEFAARKFLVGAVGNTTSSYRGVALIVSGAAGQSAAFSVQRNVPGSDYFQDGRTDAERGRDPYRRLQGTGQAGTRGPDAGPAQLPAREPAHRG